MPTRRRARCTSAAESLGLDVRHAVDDVLGVEADLGVVVAFGQLIKPPVLARLPMINLHFSLLPTMAWCGTGRTGDHGR